MVLTQFVVEEDGVQADLVEVHELLEARQTLTCHKERENVHLADLGTGLHQIVEQYSVPLYFGAAQAHDLREKDANVILVAHS